MKHLRMTEDVRAEAGRVVGAISFVVDAHGEISAAQRDASERLRRRSTQRRCEAVREAAPYPPPPMGLPVGMKFVYGGKAGG